MRLTALLGRAALLALFFTGPAVAQNPASATGANNNNNNTANTPAPTPTPSGNNSGNVFVTTLMQFTTDGNGAVQSNPLTFTLTLNASASTSAPGAAPTAGNGTVNGTDGHNSTNVTVVPWNDTMGYLPFKPKLDPAFGIGGALLILTGIPVATFGDKHRWSALAIISGYSVGLFCLLIILSFGVMPMIQSTSPSPPTTAMRGLYLLATGISTLIGGALGVFFYTFARYWVGAAGGFSIGWFLLALRKGGLLTDVGPRWGLVGGLTVASLLAALTPRLHDYVLLYSSAWIGATAFTLGVDCFTRAGLKEFYIYNLGYSGLFPKLEGQKYPLTQSMQVEIGVIAAAALIAAAIQFKILTVLKKRRTQLREEEEARIEAEEIAKAAENFKNLDAELNEWEGKHGTLGSSSKASTALGTPGPRRPDGGAIPRKGLTREENTPVPENPPTYLPLAFDGHQMPSTRTLVNSTNGKDNGKEVLHDGTERPPTGNTDSTRRLSLMEEMGYDEEDAGAAVPDETDTDLAQKLALLAEVRRARQSIRSSMDQIRYSTGGPLEGWEAGGSRPGTYHERSGSVSSGQLLDSAVRSRRNSTTSGRVLDAAPVARVAPLNSDSSEHLVDTVRSRKESSGGGSVMDRPRPNSWVDQDEAAGTPRSRHSSASGSQLLDDVMNRRRSSVGSLGMLSQSPAQSHTPSQLQSQVQSRAESPSNGALEAKVTGRDEQGSKPLTAAEMVPLVRAARQVSDQRLSLSDFRPTFIPPTEPPKRLSYVAGPAPESQQMAPQPQSPQPPTEWEQYKENREIVRPQQLQPEPPSVNRRTNDFAVVSDSVARAIDQRAQRASTMMDHGISMTAGAEYGSSLNRALATETQTRTSTLPVSPAKARGSVDLKKDRRASADARGLLNIDRSGSMDQLARGPRAMSTEEFAERHRQKLARLQDQASGPMREEIAVAAAREHYEQKQRMERDEQRRKEEQRERRNSAGVGALDQAAKGKPSKKEADSKPSKKDADSKPPTTTTNLKDHITDSSAPRTWERNQRMDEWRKSIPLDPPTVAAAVASTSKNKVSTAVSPPANSGPFSPSSQVSPPAATFSPTSQFSPPTPFNTAAPRTSPQQGSRHNPAARRLSADQLRGAARRKPNTTNIA